MASGSSSVVRPDILHENKESIHAFLRRSYQQPRLVVYDYGQSARYGSAIKKDLQRNPEPAARYAR